LFRFFFFKERNFEICKFLIEKNKIDKNNIKVEEIKDSIDKHIINIQSFCDCSDYTSLIFLINNGLKINLPEKKFGMTKIFFDLEYKSDEFKSLENDADFKIKNFFDESAIPLVFKYLHIEKFKIVIKHGVFNVIFDKHKFKDEKENQNYIQNKLLKKIENFQKFVGKKIICCVDNDTDKKTLTFSYNDNLFSKKKIIKLGTYSHKYDIFKSSVNYKDENDFVKKFFKLIEFKIFNNYKKGN
jgi:hypothetical protein